MRLPLGLLGAALVGGACSHSPGGKPTTTTIIPPGHTQVLMSFDRAKGFYTAPFPSDDLRAADGTINLAAFPNPNAASLMVQATSLASQAGGFGRTAGVFFETTAAIDPASLPDLKGSTATGASVFLLGIDPKSPDYLKRYPVTVSFAADGGPFGAANLLSLVPLQGAPMRAATAYAAVITTAVKDASGAALAESPAIATIATASAPAGMPAAALATYSAAMAAMAKAGVAKTAIAGLAAFTTGDPLAQTTLFRDDVLSRPLPVPDAPFAQTDLFDEYCVYRSTIPMPDYQAGTPPFTSEGGGWQVDSAGKPIFQRNEEAHILVTVPRRPMPPSGLPVAVFVRTGGGGDRPLVDRGTQGTTNGPALVPGTGPALFLARAGFAGVSVDGPLGGLRNTANANEDYTIFNIFNALALRDNIRQSALELIVQAHVLPTLSVDVSDCPGAVATGAGTAKASFDVAHLAIMGHSMGATITPLAVALEPAFKSVVLSGSGSSWIENVLYKQLPLNVKPAIEFLLQYDTGHGQVLTEHDPALSVFQWALESADPQVYDDRVSEEPIAGTSARQVLMFQGIVDHYILPDIANATTLTLGLDLAGPELDQSPDEPAGQTAISALLAFAGRAAIPLPASGNVAAADGTRSTGVVVQALGDGIEDGHEVMFQTDGPKHQYECFLASSLSGIPTVPAVDGADAGCP